MDSLTRVCIKGTVKVYTFSWESHEVGRKSAGPECHKVTLRFVSAFFPAADLLVSSRPLCGKYSSGGYSPTENIKKLAARTPEFIRAGGNHRGIYRGGLYPGTVETDAPITLL